MKLIKLSYIRFALLLKCFTTEGCCIFEIVNAEHGWLSELSG